MSGVAAAAHEAASTDGDMQAASVNPSFLPSQSSEKTPGRKRGRPPLRNGSKIDFPNHYSDVLPPLKVPKKRGRKPGFKLKARMLMTPLAISPPSSTPEPDMSSIPQDAATVPHSATPQVLTVCIYINKQANTGPNLDRKKIQQLPDHFGPDRPSVVLQQAVQGCIDSAFQQKTVFTLLTQGYGGEKISATFDGKQHLLSLPVVNSIDYVLRFLKKLCRSLHCENLFSDVPFDRHSGGSYHSEEGSRTEDFHHEQTDGKRYSVDVGDPPFNSISSSYSPKSSFGFRVLPATSPKTFPEGNRTGGTLTVWLVSGLSCFLQIWFWVFQVTLFQIPRTPTFHAARTRPRGPWMTWFGSSGIRILRLWAPMLMSSGNTRSMETRCCS